jgi:hypothetical protein
MDSADLFNGDYRPHSNDTTSKAAAKSVEKDVTRIAKRVLEQIRTSPSTCEEVEQATGYAHQTVSARIRGLVLAKHVKDSGEKRPTMSNRRAIVWQAV